MNKKIIGLSLIAGALLVGCTNQPNAASQKNSISFQEVSVPMTDMEKREVRASRKVTINGKDYPIGFHTIARSGDKIGDGIFGLIYDRDGNPIKNSDGSLKISNSNDFSSLIPVGDKIFMVSQFETRPAAMYVTELEKLPDGNLKAVNTKNIDFKKDNGLWVPCAGSITPWSTHLGSEEYEPDAKAIKSDGSINAYYNAMADYFGGNLKTLNPYDYGWTPEVIVLNENGDVKSLKHYAMGRFAHELAYVMPDQRTVFLSDDGTNVALFMFVADREGDLSSGTLYAAKWIQKDNKNGGKATLSWTSLGHATNSEIKAALNKKIKFTDIFDESKEGSNGYMSINTTRGLEYLKLKDGMDKIASRLESRRYAAMKGATTEFRKMEGITYNPNKNVVYIAMSAIGKGMEDNMKKGKPNSKYDKGGNNDIKLAYNPCGTVYELGINSEATYDLDGKIIDSKYVPNLMTGIVSGFTDNALKGNKCSVTSIANPDNVTFIPNSSTLLIGEDTGSGHQNDYIWSLNTDSKKLTRIQTTPYGSETTSLYFINNLKGNGYIMSVVQHPYGESDQDKARNNNEKRAYTGYIGPLPVINK